MIHSYPKIPTIGSVDFRLSAYEGTIFTFQEKVDGSLFAFGKVDGKVWCRSKNKVLDDHQIPSLFMPAYKHVTELDLPEGIIYYGETLCKPRHNTLKYNRIPKNNIALFSVYDANLDEWTFYELDLKERAKELDIESVPTLYQGYITQDILLELLKTESFLNGPKIEGVVVKSEPLLQGKFVSEQFKERHKVNWKKNVTNGGWEGFMDSYKNENRWKKAVIHLKEQGLLDERQSDIGPLINEVQKDILEEDKEEILKFLWNEFGNKLLRNSTKGLPEWYKKELLNS